ncbi:MAG: glutaredoxin family protein [Anaerolineae bacterium]
MFSLFNKQVDPVERSAEEQQKVDAQTAKLKLYHFQACPYCARVRSQIEALSLNLEDRDIRKDMSHREALIAGGGKPQVPALRIEGEDGSVQWMYESSDIMQYLDAKFAA